MSSAPPLPRLSLDRLRRQSRTRLFVGVSVGTTGYFAALSVASLAGEEVGGSASWSGLPGAVGIIGTALGSSAIAALLQRTTRRRSLASGYLPGAVGALLAAFSIAIGSLPLLLLGSLLLGASHAGNQLTRYVVTEFTELDHRGRALGWIVWAGTVGAVIGPSLLVPAGHVAAAIGLPELAGPYVAAAAVLAAVSVGYLVVLRPDPGELAVADDPVGVASGATDVQPDAWRRPAVIAAVAVMVTGQVVMVLLMAMTPLHIRHAGDGLGRVGLIMSAHLIGMYALAPVAGRLDDRMGAARTAYLGLGMLAASGVLAASSAPGGVLMAVALFLLGLGWSFGFVAGSSLLVRGLGADERMGIQGRVDSLVWAAAAAASLSAGLLLDQVGYEVLCLIGAALALLPVAVLVQTAPRIDLVTSSG